MVMRKLLNNASRIHLIGIKGVGMTALAQILSGYDKKITGSDTDERVFTDKVLKHLKIKVYRHFSRENIGDVDAVICSAAYILEKEGQVFGFGSAKEEIEKAKAMNIPILLYSEAVAEIFNATYGIAVAGSHGKSTTSAMAAVMLENAGLDPLAIVGTKVLNWEANARIAQNKNFKSLFVLEADEYKDAFLRYDPKTIMLTNIDWDHPDYFKTPLAYRKSFQKFIAKLSKKDKFIFFVDDPEIKVISVSCHAGMKIGYGFSPASRLQIVSWISHKNGSSFCLYFDGKNIGTFDIRLFGRHNVLNAAAVVSLGLSLGIPKDKIRRGLYAFKGTTRRFEILSASNPVIIDDYAHHPSEIKATIGAARTAFPDRRIVVLFQPHTFSRTKALFKDFVAALKLADLPLILRTYASAREKESSGGITSVALSRKLKTSHYNNIGQAQKNLKKILHPDDILITMGAGNVWEVGQYLAKQQLHGKQASG